MYHVKDILNVLRIIGSGHPHLCVGGMGDQCIHVLIRRRITHAFLQSNSKD